MTSNDAVVKLRGILRRYTGERQKVGHLGTLDPLATGVLPIAVGTATRLFDCMLQKKKTYIATFKFGATTPTLDSGSEITEEHNVEISRDSVLAAMKTQIGEYKQLPPQFSAKSVGGRRAYDIAREGGVVKLAPKDIRVENIALIDDFASPLGKNEFAFEITCSAGTYIRAIARDMAASLGTVGYMTSLARTASGPFEIADSVSFEDVERDPQAHLITIESALKDFDRLELSKTDCSKALNGIKLACELKLSAPLAVYCENRAVALGEIRDGYLYLRTRL